jgi:antitoxin MazE
MRLGLRFSFPDRLELSYIFQVGRMRVAKWGNSLAVRLPAAVVAELELKEGDSIEIRVASPREFEIQRDTSRLEALARLRSLQRPFPPGFKFDREEANAG